jgi:hypothetical protein
MIEALQQTDIALVNVVEVHASTSSDDKSFLYEVWVIYNTGLSLREGIYPLETACKTAASIAGREVQVRLLMNISCGRAA